MVCSSQRLTIKIGKFFWRNCPYCDNKRNKLMSVVQVLNGYTSKSSISEIAIECPFCHSKVIPNYLFLHDDHVFAFCPNSDCNKHFVLGYNYASQRFTIVLPNSVPLQKQFSDTISHISPDFPIVFNQAFCAEQLLLNQICGVGYRKALEFLIKDYLLSSINEDDTEKIENIKNKFLGNCIAEDVVNEQIKIVAKRAVWLGNDETHYVRKWTEKDVSHLKGLIDLTVRWIESEVETQELLRDMPNPR